MKMTIEQVASHFEGVTGSDNKRMALCPAHEDRIPSLSITETNDKILLHCHANCEIQTILNHTGLTFEDLGSDREATTTSNVYYDYADENGVVLYQTVRTPKKGFFVRRPDGDDWINSLDDTRRVLYQLPEVLAAVGTGEKIYIVEGEKDVDALRRIGLIATCNWGGAEKWNDEYTQAFEGARVVVIPDDDPPGQRHAEMLRKNLSGIADSVSIVSLPNPTQKKGFDVSDWLADEGTRDELENIIKSTSKKVRRSLCEGFTAKDLMEMDLPEPKWVVPNIIPEGATLLAGPAKAGKTFMALNAAYAVATGGMAFGNQRVDQGHVCYLYLEGTQKVLKRRVKALSTREPSESIEFFQSWPHGNDGMAKLEQYAADHSNLKLVVVDTLIAFRDPNKSGRDMYKMDYETLKPFADFAEEHDCAVLLITHTNKAAWSDDMDSISGSMGLRAAVDTQAVLKKDGSGLVLKICGRDMEEKALAFHFDSSKYTIVLDGEASRSREHESHKIMRRVLEESDEVSLSGAAIHRKAQELGYTGTRQAANNVLRVMAKDSDSGVIGGGKDGYKLSNID
jgi:putative DNA primase/helicase